MLHPEAVLPFSVSLTGQDLVFGLCRGWQGLGDPFVALVPGAVLLSRRDLSSTLRLSPPGSVPMALCLLPAWQEGTSPRVPPSCPASCPGSALHPAPALLAPRLLCGARARGRQGRVGGAQHGEGHQPGRFLAAVVAEGRGLGLTFAAPQLLFPDGLLLPGQRGSSKGSLQPALGAPSPASLSPFVPSPHSLPPLLPLPLLPPSPPAPLTLTRSFDLLRKAPSSRRTDRSTSVETY